MTNMGVRREVLGRKCFALMIDDCGSAPALCCVLDLAAVDQRGFRKGVVLHWSIYREPGFSLLRQKES